MLRGQSRLQTVVDRILGLPEEDLPGLLDEVREHFAHRHRDFDGILEQHARAVAEHDSRVRLEALSTARRLLLGAYFTHEYSVEAAALTNPSIVAAPEREGTPAGQRRFVMSLRAVGEGHISSIEWRTGAVELDGTVTLDKPGPYATIGVRTSPLYDGHLFTHKLSELGADMDLVDTVVGRLGGAFTFGELDESIAMLYADGISKALAHETVRLIHWLASSNYLVTFPEDTEISERVLFPAGPTESQGMEDARCVRFVNEDGSVVYYATYTAYDGYNILPQVMQTRDFREFRIGTLNGAAVANKGLALFPRLIDGRFAALGRNDRESMFYMTSDNVRFWESAELLQPPVHPWEIVQIGNCGSPLETEAGWLVLTHGVGPMRRYTIGAMLLDLEEPSRILGHLREPIVEPESTFEERDGYVPNVVYSCGGMLHGDNLILPYGFSDAGTGIVSVPLDDLLGALLKSPVNV
jgi:predicted GH43/DUF377 family glycosyl hydrolase